MNNTPSTPSSGTPDTTADDIAGSIVTGVWRLVRFILVWAWRLPVVSVPAISLGVLNWQTGLFWTIFGAVLMVVVVIVNRPGSDGDLV